MEKKTVIGAKSTFFVLLLLLGGFISVMATETVAATTEGDYTYEVSGSPAVATITGYTGSGGAIIIPNTLGGYTTMAIGENAFAACTNLTSVTIPDSVASIGNQSFQSCTSLTSVSIGSNVTSIGDAAFNACTALTSVTIPNSVTSIGAAAFVACTSMTSVSIGSNVTSLGNAVFFSCTALTTVNIPNSVTSIGRYAFDSCTALTSVTLPNNVTSISDSEFVHCTALTSIVIPNNVTSIGDYAFYYCAALTTVTIPSNVTSIGDYAFASCTSLAAINVALDNPNYASADGVLYNKSSTTLVQYPGGKAGAFTLPDSVTSIAAAAFWYCNVLTSVTIPNGVTSIGDYAFYYCSGLTTVSIGDNVTSIGNYAFDHCTVLTAVNIPNRVTFLGAGAFQSCASITSVSIPNGVTTINDNTFSSCTALTTVSIGKNVTIIRMAAFSSCTSLTSVTIPDSVTSIGGLVFDHCAALTSVVIPDNVTFIGGSAFQSCTALTSVVIGTNVTTIGPSAFQLCKSLNSTTFLGIVAPTAVYAGWIGGTPATMRGHAYAASNFPAPGSLWNGLMMGAVIPVIPGVPTNLTATSGNAQVVLAWVAPARDGGSAIDYYVVHQDGNALATHPTVLTATISGLINGQSYNFTVAAHNRVGNSTRSASASSIPATVPGAPQNLAATPAIGKVTLTWQAPAYNGGSAISGYKVYLALAGGSQLLSNLSAATFTYEHTNGTAGTSYTYYVVASNAVGAGPNSSQVSATPQSAVDNTMLYVGIAIVAIAIVVVG
ncbi:MAG: fibronectin type III domain-containing protein, partial [Methanomassiliicoccales archaeon]